MLRCSLDLFYFFGYREPPPFVCCLLRLEVQGFSFPLQQACGAATTCFLILFFRLQNFGSLGPQNCHPHTYFRGFHRFKKVKQVPCGKIEVYTHQAICFLVHITYFVNS
ncbi:hypothetical protein POPTR_013G013850v4 [Populus trichocarpa]|uniref:Uncharacterized protein n=1 Tax=Populus trichocarpa TaxID=3694 RepID=A0A3N7FUS4_POPTR|nr:hypothetical protein POPTR_013G013850v4 [Populus trichocarpa]